MPYTRKTRDVYELQGNYGYGHGFETLTTETERTEIVKRKREYHENEPGTALRIIKRRERIAVK